MYRMINHVFPVDIFEENEKYILEAELPGVKSKELEVKVSHDHIEISVKIEIDEELEYLHRERPSGDFTRRLNFSKPLDSSKSKLTLKNGIMRIELPYAPEAKVVKLAIN